MSNHRKPQRPSVNSVDSRVKANSAKNEPIDPPVGVELDSEEKRTLWRQYTSIRAASDWRDSDLLMLSKVVSHEVAIIEQTRLLDIEGYVIGGKENPRFKVRHSLIGQLVTMIRTLSLNSLASDARTVNKHGQQRVTERQRAGVSLLAGPNGWPG
jgi:hypothetical protein